MLTKLILLFAAVSISVAAAGFEKDKPLLKTGEQEQYCQLFQEGDPCNPPDFVCAQCPFCLNKTGYYVRCKANIPTDPFEPVTGAFALAQCAPGYLVDPTKPLTSELQGGLLGGQCTAWDDLDPTIMEYYQQIEDCKVSPNDRDICKYGQNPGDECTANYWFQASLNSGQEANTCPGAEDIWDAENENCAPCSSVAACQDSCGGGGSTTTTENPFPEPAPESTTTDPLLEP